MQFSDLPPAQQKAFLDYAYKLWIHEQQNARRQQMQDNIDAVQQGAGGGIFGTLAVVCILLPALLATCTMQ